MLRKRINWHLVQRSVYKKVFGKYEKYHFDWLRMHYQIYAF